MWSDRELSATGGNDSGIYPPFLKPGRLRKSRWKWSLPLKTTPKYSTSATCVGQRSLQCTVEYELISKPAKRKNCHKSFVTWVLSPGLERRWEKKNLTRKDGIRGFRNCHLRSCAIEAFILFLLLIDTKYRSSLAIL